MTTFNRSDIREIVERVSENPKFFLYLAKKHCKSLTEEQVRRSMLAWDIDPDVGYLIRDAKKNTTHRTTWRR